MKIKVVGILVCMLLIATALPAVGTLNDNKTIRETIQQVPDLTCSGNLIWVDVPPGAIVTGSFTVENIGDPGSELDWEIDSYPSWGTWTFVPSSGTGLTPEMGPITITVEVVAPDTPCTTFNGEIIIVNTQNPNDYCIIPVSLTTLGDVTIVIPPGCYSGADFPVDLVNNCPYLLNGINWRIDWTTIGSLPPGYPAGYSDGVETILASPGSVTVYSGPLPPAGSGFFGIALLKILVTADCATDVTTIAILLYFFGISSIKVF